MVHPADILLRGESSAVSSEYVDLRKLVYQESTVPPVLLFEEQSQRLLDPEVS
jgi:hypothetical protein